jgi:dTMP kinase
MIDDGYFVISDRFYDSSLVYQGILKQVPIEDIMKLKQMIMGNFEPNFTIILDLDADASMRRVEARCFRGDEYDEMSRAQYETIRSGFCKISKTFPFRTVLINGEGSQQAVFSRIWKAVKRASGLL